MKKNLFLILFLLATIPFYGQTWTKTSVSSSLSFSTPFDMKLASLDLSEETKKKVDSYITYSGQNDDESFVIMAVSTIYNSSIKTNLPAAVDACVNGLKGTPTSELHYDRKELTNFGVDGYSAIGYVENPDNGQKSYFRCYFYGKENKYWNIIIMYLKDNDENRNTASKIYQSIKIVAD
jgi:hypothetical protein